MYPFYAVFLGVVATGIALHFRRRVLGNASWWLFIPLLYGYLWHQFSLITIERGYYITEQAAYSEFTGAGLRYAVFFIITMIGFRLLLGHSSDVPVDALRRAAIRGSGLNSLLLMASAVVVLLLAGNAALSASGWSGPINRFNWWENSRFPVLRSVTGEVCWPVVYGIGVGLSNAIISRDRAMIFLGGGTSLAYMFFLVRMGQKYSGLIPPLFALALPLVFMFRLKPVLLKSAELTRDQLKANRRLVFGSLAVATILFATAFGWFASTWQNSRLAMGTIENLAYRVLVIQAHTYFGADYLHFEDRVKPSQAWDALRANEFSSIATVMEIVGDPELVQDYTQRGVRYATIHPSISILIGGVAGAAVMSFIIGAICGVGAKFFNAGSMRGSVGLQYCGISLVMVAYGLLMMSEISILVSVKFLVPAIGGAILMAVTGKNHRGGAVEALIPPGAIGARPTL